jgi:predicted MFS family arabinose efflux permease
MQGSTRILLFCSFLIPFGSFLVLPYVPIMLSNTGGMDMRAVGWILAVTSLIQFGGGLVGGVIADRIGLKKAMVLGLLTRSLGFGLIVLSTQELSLLIPSVFLIAAGAAIYLPANKAYLIRGLTDEQRSIFLSFSNSAFNAGMGLGPLVGSFFILSNPSGLFSFTLGIFVLATALHIAVLPNDRLSGSYHAPTPPKRIEFGQAAKLLVPLSFNFMAFYCYFYFQNYIGPYVIENHSAEMLGAMLLLNSVLVIFIQPLAAKRIELSSYGAILSLSFLAVALGASFLSFGNSVGLLLGVVFFTTMEILIFLKNDLVFVAALPESPATAFGLQRLSGGIGAFISSAVGGALFARAGNIEGSSSGEFWLWLSVQCVVLVVASALYWLSGYRRRLPTT